jgi:hypothetical protein
MPTGGSESAADRTLGGLIKDNQQTAFQLNRRQKRSRFAGPLHLSEAINSSTSTGRTIPPLSQTPSAPSPKIARTNIFSAQP